MLNLSALFPAGKHELLHKQATENKHGIYICHHLYHPDTIYKPLHEYSLACIVIVGAVYYFIIQ